MKTKQKPRFTKVAPTYQGQEIYYFTKNNIQEWNKKN